MNRFRRIAEHPLLAAMALIGIVFSPVLIGYAPLGGEDPELMYLPIKAEFARFVSAGRLPLWSDRFGLGVPLAAESHIAAFYPLNWLFYSALGLLTAYRITMWTHMVALVGTTFAYARVLGISKTGSVLAALVFGLCGFQAVHAKHEPFYHLMVYLPLCLLIAELYARTGRLIWIAALALAWGVQLTLGHFQIQMWTAGLALLTGGWRVLTANGTRRTQKLGRLTGLVIALCWGAAIASVPLSLTSELTGVSGFMRPPQYLSNFLLPPSHWAQFALPEVYLGRPHGVGDLYWNHLGTTSGEACAYVGIVPFILAFVGFVAEPRDRSLTPWKWIVPVSLALATMPGWWPDGFNLLLQLPGLGWFRAPARYTLLTSLGFALLAGRGLDHAITARRFTAGMTMAILVGLGAAAWSIHVARGADFQAGLGIETFTLRFGSAGLMWAIGIAMILAWRRKRVGAWALILLTVVELVGLFFTGPVWWRWQARLPEASPVLERLAGIPDAGLIAGRLLNLPVILGGITSYPNFGITPPPPNYLLEASISPPGGNTDVERRWQRRFGVTHGVWRARDDVRGTEVIAEIRDPVLDEILSSVTKLAQTGLGPWKLVRIADPFPPIRVARRVHKAANWGRLYTELSRVDGLDDAWFLAEDHPPTLPEPVATKSRITNWDGRTATVEHDGSCILIVRRTYYPGWQARINGGNPEPVVKVDGGLQGIRLTGAGTSRVSFDYTPVGLARSVRIAVSALGLALVVLFSQAWRRR